jgi:hypothetical protein
MTIQVPGKPKSAPLNYSPNFLPNPPPSPPASKPIRYGEVRVIEKEMVREVVRGVPVEVERPAPRRIELYVPTS